ncbi:hypothetical protein J437_LFUL006322 [Ladona fulva]|uniref:Pro-resilin n=1 Tax=Ladona fulva TaxID=123851 RepID=A0A8K0NVM1_LADFU|nr:hypothetical protein J437_LFUL006322 [Ladona fulva]
MSSLARDASRSAPIGGDKSEILGQRNVRLVASSFSLTRVEPASYQFSYKVEDAEAGLNFGHEEAREGDEATGEYFVLLPDGRTLRVTYVANNDGYQPEITYEEPKNGGNGNGYY